MKRIIVAAAMLACLAACGQEPNCSATQFNQLQYQFDPADGHRVLIVGPTDAEFEIMRGESDV